MVEHENKKLCLELNSDEDVHNIKGNEIQKQLKKYFNENNLHISMV